MVDILAVLVAASIAALGAYLAASRRLSGKINTSEASQLWQESASIREDYRERLSMSERRTLGLEERVAQLERDNNLLTRENGTLLVKNRELEELVTTLRGRLDVLEQENQELRTTVSDLLASLKKEQE